MVCIFILIILLNNNYIILIKTGVLDMSQSPEDYSFLVYASVVKGDSIINPTGNFRAEATIRKASTGISETISMRDDGICRFISTITRNGLFYF